MQIRREYRSEPVCSPLSFWVHRAREGETWASASAHDPPRPRAVPGRGWPIYIVAYRGRRLVFASLAEIDSAIAVLGQRHLPTTLQLAREAGFPRFQHGHWLSTLPAFWKPWKTRRLLVRRLQAFRERETSRPWRASPGSGGSP